MVMQLIISKVRGLVSVLAPRKPPANTSCEPMDTPTIDLEDAIAMRCEMDMQRQEIETLRLLLEDQSEELDHLRGIADQAGRIWHGRAARDRLFVLVSDWQERYGKYHQDGSRTPQ